MAKVIKSQIVKKSLKKKKINDIPLPFTKENYFILISGIIVIIIGYILMEMGGAYDSLSLVVSPIVLIIGYCVVIPLSIFYRKKNSNLIPLDKS